MTNAQRIRRLLRDHQWHTTTELAIVYNHFQSCLQELRERRGLCIETRRTTGSEWEYCWPDGAAGYEKRVTGGPLRQVQEALAAANSRIADLEASEVALEEENERMDVDLALARRKVAYFERKEKERVTSMFKMADVASSMSLGMLE